MPHRGFPRPVRGRDAAAFDDFDIGPLGGLMHVSAASASAARACCSRAVNGSWQGSLRVLSTNDGKLKTVVENSNYGRFLASGYLVYYQRETLFAVPDGRGPAAS